MPNLIDNKVTYASGEALPEVGSSAYVAAQNGQINPLNSYTSETPPPVSNNTVTSASLAPTNSLNIPQASYTPTTTALGIANNNTASSAATDANYTPPAPQSTSSTDNLRKSLGLLTQETTGNQTQISNLQNDAGLLAKKQTAQTLGNNLDYIDKNFQDQVKTIRETFQGSPSGMADAISKAQDVYQNTRANAALSYRVANQDYQGAQDIVDHKIQSLKDMNDQNIKLYTLQADAIRNDLTDSEAKVLDSNLATKREQAKAVTDAYSTVLQNSVQNNAPASVLSALDSESRNPNATVASIYSAAGKYGAVNSYSVVTNPLTGEQSAFDTKTGKFVNQSGETIPSGTLATNIPLATSTINATKPVVAGGQVVHPPTGNLIVDTAQQLVDGNTIPTLIPKRGVQYNAILTKANELSIAQTGKPYSATDTTAAYKFRNSGTYQKFIANAPVAMSTINTIVNDVHTLQNSGFNMNNVDLFNNFKLKATAGGYNPFATDEQRATAKELINTLGSISADDIGLLLGSGSGSDYKTKLGGAIFDVSGNLKSTDQIAKTVNDRIQAKLNDYYRIAGVSDPSIYATRDTQAITDNSSATGATTNGTTGTTISSDEARTKYGY